MNRYICQDFYNESLRIAFRKWWVGPRIDINQEIAKRIYAEPETNRYTFFRYRTVNTGISSFLFLSTFWKL